MFVTRLISVAAPAALCCALLLGGCSDTFVDPFDNDGDIYSVFGFLSLYRTDHHVRVVPVTRFPERIRHVTDPQAEIDARVHTVDLTTGQELVWAHSLVRMADSSYGHVFSASFEPQPGRSYRIVISRSDGRTATAETRIPFGSSEDRLQFDPSEALEAVRNGDRPVPIRATLQNAFLPVQVALEYSVYSIRTQPFRVRKIHPVEIDYGRVGTSNRQGEIEFTIDMARDAEILRARISELQSRDLLGRSDLEIQHVKVKMTVLDENWVPESGVFDPAELSLPGTMSNVENGFGFFGAIGHLEQQFELGKSYNRLFGFEIE